MKTLYLLLARFESPVVQLKEISDEFLGLSPKNAEEKIKSGDIDLLTFKLRDSAKAPTMVHLEDLARFVDDKHLEAKMVWKRGVQ